MLEMKANDFLVGSSREQRLQHVTVTPDSANVLERGTVLANDGDGSYSVLSNDNVADAEVILAEDISAGATDVVATVYVSGDFIYEGLKSGVDLTDAAVLNLKNAGIYLIHGIEA